MKNELNSSILLSVLLTGSLLVGRMAVVHAQQDEQSFNLDQTVVTATRTAVDKFKANSNICIITAEDIQRNHYTDLSEALRSVPGVNISQYAPAGYNDSNSVYINGSKNIVVLINGVKQNFAGGNPASLIFSMRNLDDVDHIEVLHGSASTLYGSDAKGGVINIITKKITQNKTRLKTSTGSFGKKTYAVANQGVKNSWTWDVIYQKDKNGDFEDAHGENQRSKLDADTFNFSLNNQVSKKSAIAFHYRLYKDKEKFAAPWEKLKDGSIDKHGWDIIYNLKPNNKSKNQFSISDDTYYSEIDSYLTDVQTWRIADQFDQKLGRNHLLTSGFEYTHDKILHDNGISKNTLTNRSYYLQDQWQLTPALKLTSGVRYDDNSGFGKHSTPSFNLGYLVDSKTNVYISYSDYFLTPTPSQLYNTYYGNPDIKPETGINKEIGINHRFTNSLSGSAHFFKRQSENTIGYLYSTGHYGNVGNEHSQGWDVQMQKKFNDFISSSIGFTHVHIDPTQQRTANIDGYIPESEWNIATNYTNKEFDASVNGRGIINQMGPQTADVLGNFFPQTTYWVWDLAMNYKLTSNAKVFFKVNNVFNQFYAECSNARSNWWGQKNEWWNAPGRSFMIGVQYDF
ncbi:TonB-dependent receptor plug domain-containing protein [Pectinatus sottacetonis]|uniref:TonB-dependent receptor plug domain-containing protein n=1 Tax=Pectinatus sottacetonis TaxID=1002795 RepID=UPI001E2A330E|nr:TonB-dependent receptor [Pectinatus sottacetonis]